MIDLQDVGEYTLGHFAIKHGIVEKSSGGSADVPWTLLSLTTKNESQRRLQNGFVIKMVLHVVERT